MDARNWPPLVQALRLPEVAELLGIPHRHLLELIGQELIAVCTRKPLPVGDWYVVRLGFDATESRSHNRAPFDGRRLARLEARAAAECVVTGQTCITWVHEEPRHPSVYIEEECTRWMAPGPCTVVATDDLLISRVEFEHFIYHFGQSLQLPIQPSASDAALGASRRQQLQGFADRPREDRDARKAEFERWRTTAAAIQQERSRPASIRDLAKLVKNRLNLPDSPETIRKRIREGL